MRRRRAFSDVLVCSDSPVCEEIGCDNSHLCRSAALADNAVAVWKQNVSSFSCETTQLYPPLTEKIPSMWRRRLKMTYLVSPGYRCHSDNPLSVPKYTIHQMELLTFNVSDNISSDRSCYDGSTSNNTQGNSQQTNKCNKFHRAHSNIANFQIQISSSTEVRG